MSAKQFGKPEYKLWKSLSPEEVNLEDRIEKLRLEGRLPESNIKSAVASAALYDYFSEQLLHKFPGDYALISPGEQNKDHQHKIFIVAREDYNSGIEDYHNLMELKRELGMDDKAGFRVQYLGPAESDPNVIRI